MPKDFDDCVKEGGRVRTINPNEDTYIHICYDKDNKSHTGDVHHKGSGKQHPPKRSRKSGSRKSGSRKSGSRKSDSRKLLTGPNGGTYYWRKGRKVYVKESTK